VHETGRGLLHRGNRELVDQAEEVATSDPLRQLSEAGVSILGWATSAVIS
jgi:hypothetical protein